MPYSIMKKIRYIYVIGVFFLSCRQEAITNPYAIPPPSQVDFHVTETLPHNTKYFTEGLVFYDPYFYESTGIYGLSKLVCTKPFTGQVVKEINLLKEYFGEGISIVHNKLYQLTWKEKKVFVYDVNTFKKEQEFNWNQGEGWGMTTDGISLFISTGSSNIYVVDPINFQVKKTISVQDNDGLVSNLNSLQYVKGKIFANIWLTQTIDVIDVSTGRVVQQLDCSNLLASSGKETGNEAEFNGIAYDSTHRELFVTGKYWPVIFGLQSNSW